MQTKLDIYIFIGHIPLWSCDNDHVIILVVYYTSTYSIGVY